MTDYVLEVEGPTPSSMSIIIPGSSNIVDNLLENEMYSFHVIVSNSVGNVSTIRTTICEFDSLPYIVLTSVIMLFAALIRYH